MFDFFLPCAVSSLGKSSPEELGFASLSPAFRSELIYFPERFFFIFHSRFASRLFSITSEVFASQDTEVPGARLRILPLTIFADLGKPGTQYLTPAAHNH